MDDRSDGRSGDRELVRANLEEPNHQRPSSTSTATAVQAAGANPGSMLQRVIGAVSSPEGHPGLALCVLGALLIIVNLSVSSSVVMGLGISMLSLGVGRFLEVPRKEALLRELRGKEQQLERQSELISSRILEPWHHPFYPDSGSGESGQILRSGEFRYHQTRTGGDVVWQLSTVTWQDAIARDDRMIRAVVHELNPGTQDAVEYSSRCFVSRQMALLVDMNVVDGREPPSVEIYPSLGPPTTSRHGLRIAGVRVHQTWEDDKGGHPQQVSKSLLSSKAIHRTVVENGIVTDRDDIEALEESWAKKFPADVRLSSLLRKRAAQ